MDTSVSADCRELVLMADCARGSAAVRLQAAADGTKLD